VSDDVGELLELFVLALEFPLSLLEELLTLNAVESGVECTCQGLYHL
jgi:hypothetical protein